MASQPTPVAQSDVKGREWNPGCDVHHSTLLLFVFCLLASVLCYLCTSLSCDLRLRTWRLQCPWLSWVRQCHCPWILMYCSIVFDLRVLSIAVLKWYCSTVCIVLIWLWHEVSLLQPGYCRGSDYLSAGCHTIGVTCVKSVRGLTVVSRVFYCCS